MLMVASPTQPADDKSSLGAWSGSRDTFLNFTSYYYYAGVKVDQGVLWPPEVISSQMLVQVPASTYVSPTSASQVRLFT